KGTEANSELKKKLYNQGFFANLFTSEEKKAELKKLIEAREVRLESARNKKRKLDVEIQDIEKGLVEVVERINAFDNTINEVSKQFDASHAGKLTGAAGIMILANLGGFATYTFLTSMMSVLSMGTLGFGAYTAATSLLSIIIGPVGWAGLGMFAIFSLGKPKMSKLMPIVATIGAIRQRVKYG
ncbi:MAG: hypothetical protein GY816_18435, partial [Cytophagales bacterium]|nr:hypothetical protein [Cytophagales bacterium]